VSIERLKAELGQIAKRLDRSAYTSPEFGKIPQLRYREDLFPLLNFPTFARQQETCLDCVDTAVTEVLSISAFASLCVLLGGSVARLEYLPAISDLDFLAIDTTSDDSEVWRQLRKNDDVARARDECDRFEKFENALKAAVGRRFKTPGDGPSKVEVGARPLLDSRSFFSRRDLFEELGREREANWAAWARAVLMFESAAWGDSTRILEVRAKAHSVYGAAEDILAGGFPGMTCLFINLLATSGLLAKLGVLRKIPAERLDADPAGGPQMADAELVKAVFSRQWSSWVNRIFLHAIYWCSVLSLNPWVEGPMIHNVLRATPIAKIVLYVPDLVDKVDRDIGKLWLEVKGRNRPETIPQRTVFLKQWRDIYRSCVQIGTPARAGAPPMWYRFLQMLSLALQVRNGKPLDNVTLDWVGEVNREMESILRKCIWLSRLLLPPVDAVPRSYERLVIWLGGETT
jgi:hypothetical protein